MNAIKETIESKAIPILNIKAIPLTPRFKDINKLEMKKISKIIDKTSFAPVKI